jgi:ketosteroid isomerase-like protein
MIRRRPALLVLAAFLTACSADPAVTSRNPDHAVRAALLQWNEDFNAGRKERICDLFATALRYDFGSFPERGYRSICDLLRRSLDDPARRYRYDLEIKEVLASGDLAVVRLVWTLEVSDRATGERLQTSVEPGMDVFRRGEDGRWKIVRYLAFERKD